MEIRYSKHILLRLKMRGIPYELPRVVYEKAKQRFKDTETDLEIAVLRTSYLGKQRDIAVTYRTYSAYILLITIHPLKSGQLENRVRLGRWKEIHN